MATMRNGGLRFRYMDQYTAISQQFGKISAKESFLMDEPDLEKAIAHARSIRGHVAVILKELHSIRRQERFGRK